MNKPIGIETISKSAHIRIIAVSLLLLSGCQSLYYKTMSKLGKEKRDILVARVKESKKEQEKTKEQIQTTMEKFQQLTGFQGGDLEKQYKQLNSEYERDGDLPLMFTAMQRFQVCYSDRTSRPSDTPSAACCDCSSHCALAASSLCPADARGSDQTTAAGRLAGLLRPLSCHFLHEV